MKTASSDKKKRSNKAAAMPIGSREKEEHCLPPVRHGLTTIACMGQEVRRLTRETFIRAALTGSKQLAVPMPSGLKVTFLCAGSRREQDLMKASLNSLKEFAKTANYEQQQVISVDAIDWTSPGGLSLVEQKLSELEGWLVLEHAVGASSSPMNIEGLLRIQHAALRRKVRVMLIVANPHAHDASNFLRMADEYFEITCCEPDPGWDDAIVIDCVALTRALGSQQGKVMCLARNVNGRYETRVVPFVSGSIKTRLMVLLRAMDKTLERIGHLVGLDKSGVSRHLKGMPSIPDPKLSKSELKRWYEACGIADGTKCDSGDKRKLATPKAKEGAEGDSDGEVEEAVAPKSRKARNKRNKRNKSR